MTDTPTSAIPPVQPPPGEERILKFVLLDGDDLRPGWRTQMLPKNARMLHVAEQWKQVCLWVSADMRAPMVKRTWQMCYTGDGSPLTPIPGQEHAWEYWGTVLHSSGLVLHVFFLDEDWAGVPEEFGKVIKMNP